MNEYETYAHIKSGSQLGVPLRNGETNKGLFKLHNFLSLTKSDWVEVGGACNGVGVGTGAW